MCVNACEKHTTNNENAAKMIKGGLISEGIFISITSSIRFMKWLFSNLEIWISLPVLLVKQGICSVECDGFWILDFEKKPIYYRNNLKPRPFTLFCRLI